MDDTGTVRAPSGEQPLSRKDTHVSVPQDRNTGTGDGDGGQGDLQAYPAGELRQRLTDAGLDPDGLRTEQDERLHAAGRAGLLLRDLGYVDPEDLLFGSGFGLGDERHTSFWDARSIPPPRHRRGVPLPFGLDIIAALLGGRTTVVAVVEVVEVRRLPMPPLPLPVPLPDCADDRSLAATGQPDDGDTDDRGKGDEDDDARSSDG